MTQHRTYNPRMPILIRLFVFALALLTVPTDYSFAASAAVGTATHERVVLNALMSSRCAIATSGKALTIRPAPATRPRLHDHRVSINAGSCHSAHAAVALGCGSSAPCCASCVVAAVASTVSLPTSLGVLRMPYADYVSTFASTAPTSLERPPRLRALI